MRFDETSVIVNLDGLHIYDIVFPCNSSTRVMQIPLMCNQPNFHAKFTQTELTQFEC